MPTRTYVSGWSSRTERGDAVSRSTISDMGVGSGSPGGYKAAANENSFQSIQARCLQNNQLWEDPEFPASVESMFFNGLPEDWQRMGGVEWLRPKDISRNPHFFSGGASRMDIKQGQLGNCWLIAAVACLQTEPELFQNVVPHEQSFTENYAGIFRFHFWQYGRWCEVLVDDRLPCWKGKRALCYMHSSDVNEFWSALLEKAYAKLTGCYEALKGGQTTEALTDFTGGITQFYQLRDKTPDDLWKLMLKGTATDSMMGCSLSNHPTLPPELKGKVEPQLKNGLVVGHAYSITDIREVTTLEGNVVQMVRVRNPWGRAEWNGAWCDSSEEWKHISSEVQKEMELSNANDGEFWMSFKDFVTEFDTMEICLLGPDSFSISDRVSWKSTFFSGGWKQKVNAGGCPNAGNPWWTNPQYRITVVDPDPDDAEGTGTVVIGVMQKDRRKLRREGLQQLSIGYSIYRLISQHNGTLDCQLFKTCAARTANSPFASRRETSTSHKLAPGEYIIVPSTFHPDQDADYVLRVYSESAANSNAKELDEDTGFTGVQKDNLKTAKKDSDKNVKEEGRQAFVTLAGADGKVDAYELQNILNTIFKREFRFDEFSTDMTRSMVALCDADMSGKLEFEDFKTLLDDMKACARAFRTMDADGSGYFSTYELRTALTYLGYKVSNATFNAIVMRFSDKEGRITFDNFVAIYMKLKSIFANFKKKDPSGSGQATYSANEFYLLTMYS